MQDGLFPGKLVARLQSQSHAVRVGWRLIIPSWHTYSMHFLVELLQRAWVSSVASMGTTTLAILGSLLYPLSEIVAELRSGGLSGMKRHWRERLRNTLAVAGCLWSLLFGYHLLYKVPEQINQEARTNGARLQLINGLIPVPALSNAKPSNRPEVAHKQLKLIFKGPDRFSVAARREISDQMQRMYEYLLDAGFELAADVPPLRTRAGRAVAMSWQSPGTVYDEQLFVPATGIADPDTIKDIYALWVFRRMFRSEPFSQFGGSISDANYNHLEAMASMYSCYYRSGLANRNVCAHDWSGAAWLKAIWNVRQKYGREFTDSVMLYTVKSWDPYNKPQPTFDAFFAPRFLKGVSVLSYDTKLRAGIEKILHDHNLGTR